MRAAGKLSVVVLGIGLLAGVSACSSPTAPQAAAGASAAVATAARPENGATLTATEFAAAMQLPGTVIVDVRTPAEFAQGHIQGAINLDVNAPDFTAQLEKLPKDGSYAIYCRSGNRSMIALATFDVKGFTHAYHMDGGVGAWQAAGQKLVTG